MIYELKSPILGLEQVHRVELKPVDSLFARIECVDNPEIQLYLVNPYQLQEYSFEVPRYISLLLDLKDSSQLLVYSVMMVQNPLERSRVNFLAPILFNQDNHTAAQIALSVRDYPHFHVSEELRHFVRESAA